MTARLLPGKRLRKALDAAVEAAGLEWSATDLALNLPLVESTADRVELLRGKLAAEADTDGPLPVRAVQLASELRQLEASLSRQVAALGIDDADDEPVAKSPRHVAAARTRWDRRSHRQVAR